MKDQSGTLFSVKGKIALVTGSTGALGYEFARALAEHGAVTILNGRNRSRLEEKVNRLRSEGYAVHGMPFDVTRQDQVPEAIQKIEKEIGGVDILVNNAGITLRAPLEEITPEEWHRVMETNLTGPYLVARKVVPSMIRRRSGKIINIGSVQCEISRPSIAAYAASKGGIRMLTRGMAVDWAKYNIQVNGIAPGYFKTELTKPLYEDPEFDRWLCSRTPENRWGNPDELTGALLFLASGASSYVNGHMLYVDGGMMASV